MGLATIDPHSYEVQTKEMWMFLNHCISVKTNLINTQVGDFVNLGVHSPTMWINSC